MNYERAPGKKLTTEIFNQRAKNIHNDKYDYSKVIYVNGTTRVDIICSEHGIFKQLPQDHLHGSGCSKCKAVTNSKRCKFTTEKFIQLAIKSHGNKYDYSEVNYIGNKTRVNIICKKHGIFNQFPDVHIKRKCGCPRCNDSKGETEISEFLKLNNIEFIQQYKFNNCRDKYPLPFDFYLPDYNICIEFDGIQHSQPIKRFGGLKAFNKIQNHDLIKTNFCLTNNIKLIRINSINKNINIFNY